MHPLLVQKRWFRLCLTAWLLAAVVLAALVKFMRNPAWKAALALGLPLALIYAFMCLAAWYLCRAFPLSRTAPSRLITVHLLTAAVTSALWITLGRAWSALWRASRSGRMWRPNMSASCRCLPASACSCSG